MGDAMAEAKVALAPVRASGRGLPIATADSVVRLAIPSQTVDAIGDERWAQRALIGSVHADDPLGLDAFEPMRVSGWMIATSAPCCGPQPATTRIKRNLSPEVSP